jgi:hypothetical protein
MVVIALAEDPIITIRDLLIANWTPANTSSLTPNFSTGGFDAKAAYDQITLDGPYDIATIEGQRADGSGLCEQVASTVYARAWSVRRDSSPNPKQLRWEYGEEIIRIVKAVEMAPPTGIDLFRVAGTLTGVDATKTPTAFWREIDIELRWMREPN